MAYEGYRLKINGVVFNNTDIARGSFSISTSPRLCDSYIDAVGIRHDVFYPTAKTKISFSIREHKRTEHEALASCFTSRQNVSVEYYDEATDTYKNGVFSIEELTWAHSNAGASFIDYAATPVTMEEY